MGERFLKKKVLQNIFRVRANIQKKSPPPLQYKYFLSLQKTHTKKLSNELTLGSLTRIAGFFSLEQVNRLSNPGPAVCLKIFGLFISMEKRGGLEEGRCLTEKFHRGLG